MGINVTRMLLGGLVAGVVINCIEYALHGVVLKEQWAETMQSMNRNPEPTTAMIVGFNVRGFSLGVAVIWLYAAIRNRFGPGPSTAITAAMFIWLVGYAGAMAGPAIQGLFPLSLVLTALAVGSVEIVVATVLGAAIYKEAAATAAAGAGS